MIVSYKWFHVRVRNGRTFAHVATVSANGEVLWAKDIGQVSATVKESMAPTWSRDNSDNRAANNVLGQ